jgi:hypothetical protein
MAGEETEGKSMSATIAIAEYIAIGCIAVVVVVMLVIALVMQIEWKRNPRA